MASHAKWDLVGTLGKSFAATWQPVLSCAHRYSPLLMLSMMYSARGSKKMNWLSYFLTISASSWVNLALAYMSALSLYGAFETILPAALGYMPGFFVYTRTLALFTSICAAPPR